MCNIHSCLNKFGAIKEETVLLITASSISLVSSIAFAIIFSGATLGTANHLIVSATFGFNLLALVTYVVSIFVHVYKEKKVFKAVNPPPKPLITKLEIHKTHTVKYNSSSSELLKNLITSEDREHDSCETDSYYSANTSRPSSPELSPKQPKSPKIVPPTRQPRQVLAKDVVPTFFKSFEGFLGKMIHVDSTKLGDKQDVYDKKIQKLHQGIEAFTRHFQQLVSEPKPFRPGKSTQIVRRMLAVWNTKQYELLPALFDEFDLAMSNKKNEFIDSKPLKSEEDLMDFVQRIIFHCSLIMGDVDLLLKQSTADMAVMREANVSYLLQESKELATASKKEFAEFERILTLQAEINQKKIWSGWWITNSIEYMIMRHPNNKNQKNYDEIMRRVQLVMKKQIDNSNLLSPSEKKNYQVIYCTLGTPGTWNLKRYELTTGFSLAKSVAAKAVPLFKSRIVPLIRDGLVREQFIEKNDPSLDQPLSDTVDAILYPLLHIFMKEYAMDTLTIPVLKKVKEEMDSLHKLSQTESLEIVLKTIQTNFAQIAEEYEKSALKE